MVLLAEENEHVAEPFSALFVLSAACSALLEHFEGPMEDGS
jgi:hypothetical protein